MRALVLVVVLASACTQTQARRVHRVGEVATAVGLVGVLASVTKQAASAARAEDCTQVQAIAPRVRDLDADFHVTVFMRDVAIKRCLREQ